MEKTKTKGHGQKQERWKSEHSLHSPPPGGGGSWSH